MSGVETMAWRHEDGTRCVLRDGRWWVQDDEFQEHKGPCHRSHSDDFGRGEFGFPGVGLRSVPSEVVEFIHPSGARQSDVPTLEIALTSGYLDVRYGDQGNRIPLSEQAHRVCSILVEAMSLFAEKNMGYGSTSVHLGAKGQYADMHRKMGKLKHTLWDGNQVVGEGLEEMVFDLIGHSGLTVDFLREEGL